MADQAEWIGEAALSTPDSISAQPPFDWQRYRQLGWFFGKVLLHFLWWDLLLNQPLLRRLRTAPRYRWQRIARAYCTLAIQMGGVPIKLGQFLSLRIDLLPFEVTQTLAMLQDQVPAAPLTAIRSAIETDLARPLSELFTWFAPQPVASASLAQVHHACLPSGEQVVVKVLRPGTTTQIEMDLVAIGLLLRLLKHFRQIRAQIDLERVLAEFSTVTRRELDFGAEGKNVERFRRDFANDPHVYIPNVYWAYSSVHILTLENVGYFKLSDWAALEAAGIQRAQVAQQLAQLYLKQIFITHFVHADPHPGNLFIKPLTHPAENRQNDFAPGEAVPYWPDRPFQIVLIDFGMAAEIPEAAQLWLREFIIGLGLRDAQRIVHAYVTGGLLRPGVDVAQVEAMTVALLDDFQETLVGLMPDRTQAKTHRFFAEYADLLSEYPFQVPVNLLFMYRALNLMGSQVKQLDPDFDLTAAAAPFATALLWQSWQTEWQEWLQGLATLGRLLLASPPQPERILIQAQTAFKPPESFQMLFRQSRTAMPPPGLAASDRRVIERLIKAVERLTWTVGIIGLLVVGELWHVGLPGQSSLTSITLYPGRFILLFLLAPVLFIIRWLLLK